ncbi:hypothetical protein A33M_3121 [Rhodovulum sp. PH10]|nr:hypothetical protein A33M_3121 [Rhodovulum sp. PH10]
MSGMRLPHRVHRKLRIVFCAAATNVSIRGGGDPARRGVAGSARDGSRPTRNAETATGR